MLTIRSLFLGILVAAIGYTAYGQTNKLDLGIEGGPSVIFLRGNHLIDEFHDPTLGFCGGVFVQYNFSRIASIHTSIFYERKGSASTIQLTDINGSYIAKACVNTHYDYLTVPILLRASFGSKNQLFLSAGPYFGYLVAQSYTVEADNFQPFAYDDISNDKRFDTGISAGIGMSVPIKTKFDLSFELRNNLGLFNTSAVSVVNDGTIRTNSTVLIFGFGYKVGERIAPGVE